MEIDATGDKKLAASSPGFINATSSVFTVAGAAFTQLLVLAGFIALAVIAARRFHPGAPAPAQG